MRRPFLAKEIRKEMSVRAERAILVALLTPDRTEEFDDLAELEALADTAGAKCVGHLIQRRPAVDPAYYLGKGKINELARLAEKEEAQVIIFDNDLSPGQIRNIEKIVERKVLDRSELILDIFATRARSKEARLQVELAQLQYTYPRLTHMWGHLERIAGAAGATGVGGIGTRGPGEKQLEIDRRLVRKRLDILKRELKEIDERKLREVASRKDQFTICLVGYTNAGKSTLMNALTGADVYVEDKLFATLDTRTRKWHLGEGRNALLSDTVGFVRQLPHHLVASFKATLEEAIHADLLLHVVDAANPQAVGQMMTVKKVLEDLGCTEKSIVTVFNKIDCLPVPEAVVKLLKQHEPVGIPVSAFQKINLDLLTERATWYFHRPAIHLTLDVDCRAGKLISFLKQHAKIHQTDYLEEITARMELTLASHWIGPLRQFAGEYKIIASSDPHATEELTA
jgi:GTPase